ncbi:MAG: TIGR03960 family B12-binding radical SAM protein, partial [Elusimicrobia bacterium]|nr:TIGR03960 family B12-binding radical SAM protein [Elusimicrobiota bacterium]
MENKIEIENILPLVQKPVRYINQEWNSHRKNFSKDNTSVCLCFPDLYEVGASNLGLEILYHIINRKDSSFAERCYLPAPDMENLMRQKNIPLFSLETRTPIKKFDILGITLQYELCSANILNLLHLSEIPFYAKDRKEMFPLVIGGGPMTLNPEPLADFFDAFVLGDGEEAMLEIIDTVRKLKSASRKKEELLEDLSKIEGIYVPSFYDVDYNSDGTIKSVLPNKKGVPDKVYKSTVKLENALVPTEKIVPYMETIHNRINIEIARGCPRKCRFCSASKYYFPWRTRTPKQVIDFASKSISNTGFGEISFSSLSCTDYKDLNEVLSEFHNQFCEKRINVSLPSLRCEKFSLEIAKNLDYNKKTNLTFAPEAGTERLRNVIGKYLSDKNIIETLLLASSMGWQNVKLYFMLGLPTETNEDIEGINNLIRYIKKQVPRFNFNIALSYFVPKAQTAFQWAAMEKEENLKEKMYKLKKILPASIKSGFVEPSILEAVLARGDRRLSKVIYKAWQKGARFDQWKEQFEFSLWKASFEEEKIDYAFYIYRQRNENEHFPWDHLDFGIGKEDLLKEYKKGLDEKKGEIDVEEKSFVPVKYKRENIISQRTVMRVRLRFER